MGTVKGPWTEVKNTTLGFHYLNGKKLQAFKKGLEYIFYYFYYEDCEFDCNF